jgi:hypothetical protein
MQTSKSQGKREAVAYCHQHFLSRNTLEMIAEVLNLLALLVQKYKF